MSINSNSQQIIRLEEVKKRTGLSRSSIYAFIKEGRFPERIILGPRCVGWVDTEINEWITARIAESRPVIEQGAKHEKA